MRHKKADPEFEIAEAGSRAEQVYFKAAARLFQVANRYTPIFCLFSMTLSLES